MTHYYTKWLLSVCLILLNTFIYAQQPVSGIVRSSDGTSLPGVTVKLKGTRQGVSTGTDGRFTISAAPGGILIFSSIGYESRELKITDAKPVNISLAPTASDLSEVVVVGYGTQKKINLSGAVQQVSSKQLDSRPITNINTGLQGAIANLNISVSSGSATSAPAFNIRGITSLNGGSAFILVDNIPVTSSELALLNPSDIESVAVLKDAAAAAIYGARGAFGVILVTTKKAKSDKVQFSFDANSAIRSLGEVPEVITDPLTVMEMKAQAAAPLYTLYPQADRDYAASLSKDPSLPNTIVSPSDPNKWAYYGSTDWLHEAYKKNAPAYTGNLNISQKTEKLSYMISGGYYQQNGLLRYGNDIFKRYNFRGNGSFNLTKWWSVGTNVSFINRDYDSPPFISEDLNGFFHEVNRKASLDVPRNPDGTWTSSGASILGALQEGGRKKDNYKQTQLTFNTQIKLIKNIWSLNADASFRNTDQRIDMFNLPVLYRTGPNQPMQTYMISSVGNNSSVSVNNYRPTYKAINLYTNFQKTFAGKHDLSAVAGFNQELSRSSSFGTSRAGLISPDLPVLSLATGEMNSSQYADEVALRGFFGRVNYTYDNKYILEVNGRYDGTSRYPSNGRWGFFPSVSGAWVMSNESFMHTVKEALNVGMIKLRGSYGELGNQINNAAYPFVATMGSAQTGVILDGTKPRYVSAAGISPTTITWEKVSTLNGGIDIELFNSKLDLSFDTYARKTIGMLAPAQPLPAVLGTSVPSENAADLKTKGFEITAGWKDNFNLAGSPFNWSVRVNISNSRAWITKYRNPTGSLSNYYEGMRYGEMWGLQTEGFFQSAQEVADHADQSALGTSASNYNFYEGDIKFADLNNDGKINWGDWTLANHGDYKRIGNSQAQFPYSADLNASWKGFDLRAFFQGVGKGDYYPSGGTFYFWGIYAQPWTNVTKLNMNHWTPDNRDAYFPRVKAYSAEVSGSELGERQTKYLQSLAYLRLKNITLGYTLPSTLTKKYRIERLRFYVSGENLWTHSNLDVNLDPEILVNSTSGKVYPFQKTISFGLNMSF